jgi:hypothetical protein
MKTIARGNSVTENAKIVDPDPSLVKGKRSSDNTLIVAANRPNKAAASPIEIRQAKNVIAKAILNDQLKRVDELNRQNQRLTNIPIDAFDRPVPVYNKESFTAYIRPHHIFPWFKDGIKSYDLNRKKIDDFYRKNSWGQPSYPNNTVIDKDPLLLTTIFMPIPENIKRFGVVIEGIGDKIPGTQTSGDKTYLFYMLSKFVLFDRRYINYNVYTKPAVVAAADAAWEFQYSLVAYTSSSQVGSWRLCLTEAGNRLNKFDDYVQSTTLHYKICKK